VTLTGRIEKDDLGPGAWVLVTDDGRRFALSGSADLREGQAVRVEGRVRDDAVGIGMTGDPVLEVEAVRPA
jgi:hypothetical protein